jgi:UDP-glucose 4-epimerase
MNWLVTGGAGYIGSHIVKCLVEDGHTVSILDNFSSGSINEIKNNVKVFNEDITNIAGVHRIFFENNFDGVIHTAAKKSVAQSFLEKELYENVNVFGTLNVLNFAIKTGVKNFIYSSSAAVYGVVDSDRIKEDTETNPISPYGVTKLVAEQLVTNEINSGNILGGSIRYFNVAGKDKELNQDKSKSNIYPAIFDSIKENRNFSIFGDDYPTPDGTCVRDYIHVSDVARFHVEFAKTLEKDNCPRVVNAGAGTGVSVKNVIDSVNKFLPSPIKTQVLPQRDGDPAFLVADTSLSKSWMDFKCDYTLDDISQSAVDGFIDEHQ